MHPPQRAAQAENDWDASVAIIGGGAAGFFTAINLARKHPALRVLLFEAAPRPLRKVQISGGGRCNVTHALFEPDRLAEHYPRGRRELRSLFHRFQPQDTIAWFEKSGLPLRREADGRMFPSCNQSQGVIDLFMAEIDRLGVELLRNVKVSALTPIEGGFQIRSESGLRSWRAQAVVLATGYSPSGWELAQGLGHRVVPPVPSLFPLMVADDVLTGLQGISVPSAHGSLTVGGRTFKAEGALLVTHTGVSGPLIYRLSSLAARELADAGYRGTLLLDWLPSLTVEALQQRLTQQFSGDWAPRKMANAKFSPLPERLWLALAQQAGVNLDSRGRDVARKIQNRLVESMKATRLSIAGKSPSKEEFVSCGGVMLSEVNLKTMESRRVPGLYFAGEILDWDGLTGGFNFQACWSAAWTLSDAFRGL